MELLPASPLSALESVYDVLSDAEGDVTHAEPEPEASLALPLALPATTATAKPTSLVQGAPDAAADACSTLWSLISPCSDAGEDEDGARRFFPEDKDAPDARTELSGGDSGGSDATDGGRDSEEEDDEEDEEEEEEEVHAVDADSFWAAVERPPPVVEWWPQCDREGSEEEEDEDESSDYGTTRRELTPEEGVVGRRTLAAPRWRRLKARSYAGATSAGVQAAVASLKQRARTISSLATPTRALDDAGGFSSDDEDYRDPSAAAREPPRWPRRASLATLGARLSSAAAPAVDSLRGRFGRQLRLLRSSSSNTVTSEESFFDSPTSCGPGRRRHSDAKSAPASSSYPGARASARGRAKDGGRDARRRDVAENLRVGVARAAGMLSAASAEAAKKLQAAKTNARRSERRPEQEREHEQDEHEQHEQHEQLAQPSAGDRRKGG